MEGRGRREGPSPARALGRLAVFSMMPPDAGTLVGSERGEPLSQIGVWLGNTAVQGGQTEGGEGLFRGGQCGTWDMG